jgi:hypothetical protein
MQNSPSGLKYGQNSPIARFRAIPMTVLRECSDWPPPRPDAIKRGALRSFRGAKRTLAAQVEMFAASIIFAGSATAMAPKDDGAPPNKPADQ